MKKNIRDLEIGDFVKEKSIKIKRRVGQILSILEDSKTNPTLECILVDYKTLEPIDNLFGEHKFFKIKRNSIRHYIPRNKLFEKEKFSVGSYLMYKYNHKVKYGRVMGYLNREEGLYPHSYDSNKHNGKDLLQCVQIEPDSLKRVFDSEDHPRIFIADPIKCNQVKTEDKDAEGNPIIPRKLII